MSQPIVRVSGPADIIQSIPYMSGITPTSDDVILAFIADKRWVCTARIDRVEAKEATEAAIKAVIRQVGDDFKMIAVCYGPDPIDLDNFPDAADVLRVHNDRWWSLLCKDPECCPSEGKPLTPSAVTVAMVAAGMAPSGTEEELVTATEPIEPDEMNIGEAAAICEKRLDRLQIIDQLIGHGNALQDEGTRLVDVARRAGRIGAGVYVIASYAYWRAGDGIRARIVLEHAEKLDSRVTLRAEVEALLLSGANGTTAPPIFASRS